MQKTLYFAIAILLVGPSDSQAFSVTKQIKKGVDKVEHAAEDVVGGAAKLGKKELDAFFDFMMKNVPKVSPHKIQGLFCAKANAKKGRFSFRSFEGLLCQDHRYALMALIMCSGYDDFKGSHCHKNAKKYYPSGIGNPVKLATNVFKSEIDAMLLFCPKSDYGRSAGGDSKADKVLGKAVGALEKAVHLIPYAPDIIKTSCKAANIFWFDKLNKKH